MSGVTTLNTLQGNINLQSSSGSINITSLLAGNINLEASHVGSQGGVLNLGIYPPPAGGEEPLTGQLLLSSSGGSVVITYPDGGYPNGHKINLEATAGGVVGVNTINNVAADATHNLTLTAGANITIAPSQGTNSIPISATDTVGVASLQQNSGALITGAVQLISGSNITMSNTGAGAITINAVVDGAGIETINNVSPSTGEFGITSGSGISITTPVANGIEINNTGVVGISDVGGGAELTGVVNIVGKTGITSSISGQDINIDNDGVLSITINAAALSPPPPLSGAIGLIAGAGVLLSESGQTITITATGDGAGIESINGEVGGAAGAFSVNAGSGITVTSQTNAIDIVNSGVLSVATGASTPATGAISLVAGANVSITEASGAFTIASTGGSGGGVTGFEVNNDVLSTGVLHLNEATGITMTRGVMNDGVYFFNSGVLSVATGASTPATGAISLVAGANVSITEASGAFTIASTGGGGGGILTISGIAPNGAGDWTLDNGTGIGYTSLVPAQQGIQLTNTGVLSVKANSGGVPFTGAITIEAGSGISVAESVGGIITVTNTAQGGGGAYTYTSNVAYPITDPGNYFTQPAPTPIEIYTACDLTNQSFYNATWNPVTISMTADGPETSVVVGDTLLCSNTTHYFSCPATWGVANLTINRYTYSPQAQDTIVFPNIVGSGAYSTIYAISATDTVICILALQATLGNVMLYSYTFASGIAQLLSVLAYDPYDTFTFVLNNFTAAVFTATSIVTVGANTTYRPQQAGASPIDLALLVAIETSGTPLTVIFQQDALHTVTPANQFSHCCIQLVPNLYNNLVITYLNWTEDLPPIQQPFIEEWTIQPPVMISTAVGSPPESYYIMRNPVNASGLITQTAGSSINQVFKTYPLDATNTIITGLTPANNYSFYGPTIYQPPTPPTNIYFSSSLIDDQYLYQQAAEIQLEVYNAIPIGTTITVSFEVPCSTSVLGEYLYFPINTILIVGGVYSLVPSRGGIGSVLPSGTATIEVQIYTPVLISVGDMVQLVIPQFTILPPPPP